MDLDVFHVTDSDVFAFYSSGNNAFTVARKKKGDELPRSAISPADWPAFEEAIRKEVPEVLRSMRVLTPEESNKVRREKADRIIPSRFHFRWKPIDQDGSITRVAKCRWIIVGFHDPDIMELERSAPTPQGSTIALVTNALCHLGYEAYQGDVKSAFTQSKRIDRELYVSQPREGLPGLQQDQLLQLQTEIYGTVRGPSWWRETLVEQIKSLGYQESLYDPCLYILRSSQDQILRTERMQERLRANPWENGNWLTPEPTLQKELEFEPVEGLLLVEVDDLYEGGSERHRSLMQEIQTKFRFGKHTSLMQPEGGTFDGMRMVQKQDFSFFLSMKDDISQSLV